MNNYKWIRENGKNRTEHRKIMEDHIGKRLKIDVVVHHKDGDKRNNNIKNLQLMNRSEHASIHHKPTKFIELTCYICKNKYKYPLRLFKYKTKKGQTKFMCSKKCVGKYTNHYLLRTEKIIRNEERVKDGISKGMSGYRISKEYNMNKATVYNIIRRIKK